MTPNRISILGLGLLGGSVGLAAARALTDCKIVGYSINSEDAETALRNGAIHVSASSPGAAVANVDLVILCTPVSAYPSLLQAIDPHLERSTVVTDVGSTKENVVNAARFALKNPGQFVASHPMAGSEQQGISNARGDLFAGATCVITPVGENAQASIELVDEFWKALGLRTVMMAPALHDRYVAEISHLPHAVAAALVNVMDAAALDIRGKGFLDFTRIASGDANLWQEILHSNRTNVLLALDQLSAELTRFRNLLNDNHPQAMVRWLHSAAQRRRDLAKPPTLPEEYLGGSQ